MVPKNQNSPLLLVINPLVFFGRSVLESPSRLDEEHRLIARYAARLAAEAGNSTVSVHPSGTSCRVPQPILKSISQCLE